MPCSGLTIYETVLLTDTLGVYIYADLVAHPGEWLRRSVHKRIAEDSVVLHRAVSRLAAQQNAFGKQS